MVASENLILEGADIFNAYLYGDLDEAVIVELSTDDSGLPEKINQIVKETKSPYGQRSAGCIWGNVIHNTFKSCGFQQSTQQKHF